MPDELLTNQAADTTVTDAVEVNSDNHEIEGTGEAPELDESGNPIEPAEEIEEVEWEDGKKYSVPKALKGALMKNADYTQKTQQVAEQRHQIEDAQKQFQQQVEFQKANISDYAKLQSLDDQLGVFEKIDWQAASSQDPAATQRAWMQYQQIKDQRTALGQTLSQKEQQQAIEMQQKTAKQIEEGRLKLQKEIPDWSPKKAEELTKFAQEKFGFTPNELGQVSDVRSIKLLNMAYLGEQVIQKAKQSKQPTAIDVKPSTSFSGRAPATAKSEDRMTDAEWTAHRQKQRQKK